MADHSPTLTLHTDGGARGNPGPAAAAFVFTDVSGRPVFQAGRYLGEATNNVAEYQALIDAFEWLSLNRSQFASDTASLKLDCFSDSTLVVNQIIGNFKIKQNHLKPLVAKIHHLLKTANITATFTAIPRAQNSLADALVNQALDHHLNLK